MLVASSGVVSLGAAGCDAVYRHYLVDVMGWLVLGIGFTIIVLILLVILDDIARD